MGRGQSPGLGLARCGGPGPPGSAVGRAEVLLRLPALPWLVAGPKCEVGALSPEEASEVVGVARAPRAMQSEQ